MSTELERALAQAHDILASDAEPWKPQPGEEVLGILRARDVRTSAHSDDYPLLTIEAGPGQWWDVHAYHTVLWDEVKRQDPQVGDVVGVRYLGRSDHGGQGGEGYERYKLVVVKLTTGADVSPSNAAASQPGSDTQPAPVPARVGDGGGAAQGSKPAAVTAPAPAADPVAEGATGGSVPAPPAAVAYGEGAPSTNAGAEPTTVGAGGTGPPETAGPLGESPGDGTPHDPAPTTVTVPVTPASAEEAAQILAGEATKGPLGDPATAEQWNALLLVTDNNKATATNLVNMANKSNYTKATVTFATVAEIAAALALAEQRAAEAVAT